MIPIKSYISDDIADLHYRKLKFYLENSIQFYIDFFDILNGNQLVNDAETILYDNSRLDARTITSFFKTLVINKKQEGKKDRLIRAINNKNTVLKPYLINNEANLLGFFNHIKNHIKNIITDSPEELENLLNRLYITFTFCFSSRNAFCTDMVIILKKIFDYQGKFSSSAENNTIKGIPIGENDSDGFWHRYHLIEQIGHKSRTCSYCNRVYTFIVKRHRNKTGIVPQLDHFLDKGTLPLFALSFYNLVPSCSLCNSSLKKSTKFTIADYTHPYQQGFGKDALFKYKALTTDAEYGHSDELVIYCKVNPQSKQRKQLKNSISIFAIDKIYTEHADYVEEMICKKHQTNDLYLDLLRLDTYKNLKLSKERAYRLAFGNYPKESDFHKRPLAKLTRDIAYQLNMIGLDDYE